MVTGDTLNDRDAGQSPGVRSVLCNGLASLITIIALAWATDLFQTLGLTLYPAQIVTVVLGLAIALAFIHLPARRYAPGTATPWHDWLAAGAGMVTAGWMSARYPQLADLTVDAPGEVVSIGLTQILLTLEALRRASGLALPLIVITLPKRPAWAASCRDTSAPRWRTD